MVIGKTQNMTIPRKINWILDIVNRYKYLGAWIEHDMIPGKLVKC